MEKRENTLLLFNLILIWHSLLETNQSVKSSVKLLNVCFHHLFFFYSISITIDVFLNLHFSTVLLLLLLGYFWMNDFKTTMNKSIVDLDAW